MYNLAEKLVRTCQSTSETKKSSEKSTYQIKAKCRGKRQIKRMVFKINSMNTEAEKCFDIWGILKMASVNLLSPVTIVLA